MTPNGRIVPGVLAVLILGALGCQPDAPVPPASDESVEASVAVNPVGGQPVLPALETYADTVAMRVYEAAGGPAPWQELPFLRFTYTIKREGRLVRSVHQHFGVGRLCRTLESMQDNQQWVRVRRGVVSSWPVHGRSVAIRQFQRLTS